MLRYRFIYTPKPRQFNYKPLYYDPEQEERDARLQELGRGPSFREKQYQPGSILRARMGSRQETVMAERRARKTKTVRLVITMAVILVLAAWLILY